MTRTPIYCATGFTVLESVVVVGISTMALAALANLFFIFNSIYGYEQAFLAVAGSSGSAMNALEAAIAPAERVLASHDFSGTVYASATTTLVLEVPTVDDAGNIVSGAKDYIAFYVDSSALYRIVLADEESARVSETKRLSTTVSEISFAYDAPNVEEAESVGIDIRTRASFKQHVVENRLAEQLYLRNKEPLP